MRLKPFGRDLRLDLRKRGGGAATPLKHFIYHFHNHFTLPWTIEHQSSIEADDILANLYQCFFIMQNVGYSFPVFNRSCVNGHTVGSVYGYGRHVKLNLAFKFILGDKFSVKL